MVKSIALILQHEEPNYKVERRTFPKDNKNKALGLSSLHRVSCQLPIVIHKSHSRTFSRIQANESYVSKVLPSVVVLRRQKACLSFVKTILEVVRGLRMAEIRFDSVTRVLQEFARDRSLAGVSVSQNVLSNIQKACGNVQCIVDNFKNAYQTICGSELCDQVMTYLKCRLTAHHIMNSCRKIMKYIHVITGKLIELMLSERNMDIVFISTLSLCSITNSRIAEFVSSSYIMYGVDFELRVKESFSRRRRCKKLAGNKQQNLNLFWFLNKVGKLKSCLLSLNLSMATLDTVNASGLSSKDLQTRSPPNKSVVRTLKNLYKKILEDENAFFAQLVKNIYQVNSDTLNKNVEGVHRLVPLTRGSSPNRRRNVQWDSPIGPSHQEYMFAVYMESLWGNVQKIIIKSYISSLYGEDTSCTDRLSQTSSLVNFEQELILQINLKLGRNGSSPQTFLDTLKYLSVGVRAFWNQQKFYRGLNKSMGVVIKDRFRKLNTTNIASPSTATFKELMSCHTCFLELVSLLQKYKLFNSSQTEERSSGGLVVLSILNPLVVYYQYLRWLLASKRHQFLFSATWELYLTISTNEVKFGLLSCERITSSLDAILQWFPQEKGLLDELLQFLETFEKESLKMMVSQLGRRSRAAWRSHMSTKKVWKQRGNREKVHQSSSYINVVVQLIFGPLFESVEMLSRHQKLELITKCTSIFIKTWMDHILEERIVFSAHGAQQLNFDFHHFVSWFENEELDLSLEEISEINSLPVIANMKSAMLLLACQPDSQKKRGDDLNLMVNKHGGSSSSTISQVSIESVAGSQFDEVVKNVELHDKERWLALRAKGGQAKRFLCMT